MGAPALRHPKSNSGSSFSANYYTLSYATYFKGCGGLLADLAGYRREHVVRVAPDQTDGADHNHQYHGEHHSVFRDVLPFLIAPQEFSQICHSRLLRVLRWRLPIWTRVGNQSLYSPSFRSFGMALGHS